MYIQVIKGRKYFWKVKDEFERITLVSQCFRTKWAAKRSARKLAKANDLQIRPYAPSRRVNGIG
jgi:hypothetical protein